MHGRRVATGVALLISVGSLAPLPAAHAATGTTLYVNNSTQTRCSDATTDSTVTPYCTIQAAVDAVTPGQTIVVSPGMFYAPFSVSKSGTADSPITIEGIYPSALQQPAPEVEGTQSGPAVTVSGASYVRFSGLNLSSATTSVAEVNNSAHVTFDGIRFVGGQTSTEAAVQLSASSNVTLARNVIQGTLRPAEISVTGGTGTVVTTNVFAAGHSSGLILNGATDATVTSNTIGNFCGYGIAATSGSVSATIENNVVTQSNVIGTSSCSGVSTADVSLLVDSSSATGTTADYDDIFAALPTNTAYSWAGNQYTQAADLTAATTQASHDSNAYVAVGSWTTGSLSSRSLSAIDSANAAAPGELDTDLLGAARVDDPQVTNTGTGTQDYYDRGAHEAYDGVGLGGVSIPSKAPVNASITYSAASVIDTWSAPVTCAFDFGDGTPVVTVPATSGACSNAHVYAATGSFTATLKATSPSGRSALSQQNVSIVPAAPLVALLSLTAEGGLTVTPDPGRSTDSWNITDFVFDYGDGTTVDPKTGLSATHTYAKPGTYTVKVTMTDAGGNTGSATASFTTSTFYTPIAPIRVLDTRTGLGVSAKAKVPAHGTIRLKIAGIGTVPAAGVAAAAMNVTVTNAISDGYITVYPDAGGLPGTSNVNFASGQTVPNMVIVKVGSDGYVDLYNGSSATVDLIADLAGYYGSDSTDGYNATAPARLLDTRKSTAIPANGVTKVYVGDHAGTTAVVLNVTVTGPKAGGYLTAYPDGGNRPIASNLDFSAGQTVPNEVIVKAGADGYVDFANISSDTTDLVVDLGGYFTAGTGAVFTPLVPVRILDTRTGGQAPLAADATQDVRVEGGYSPVPIGLLNGSVAANFTVTGEAAGGFLTAYPDGATIRPDTSIVSFSPGKTASNAATVGLGGNTSIGGMYVYNGSGGQVDVIVDVFGYYSTT